MCTGTGKYVTRARVPGTFVYRVPDPDTVYTVHCTQEDKRRESVQRVEHEESQHNNTKNETPIRRRTSQLRTSDAPPTQ